MRMSNCIKKITVFFFFFINICIGWGVVVGEQSEHMQGDNEDYTVSNVTGQQKVNQTGDGTGCVLELRDSVFQTDKEGPDF